jgi:hypothetical protein
MKVNKRSPIKVGWKILDSESGFVFAPAFGVANQGWRERQKYVANWGWGKWQEYVQGRQRPERVKQ